ncbi:FliH/SctL family protein [Dyella sp. A6]|uniref:FliH/SctL family protein n=1 Tax=Dyella aluminiiresistens TaxID=3069105 RepID=UPI002E785BD7|nr:FliH/SctL family protein [Dyella sp. A6]
MSMTLSRETWLDVARWEPPAMDAPDTPAEPEPLEDLPQEVDLAALEQAAREQGRIAGLEEGRAAARAELQQSLDRFEALIDAAARPLQALDDVTGRELGRLAMVVAQRVIATELRTDPALVVRAVQQAADLLPSSKRVLRVVLHPDDLALVKSLDAAEAHWELRPDPGLTRGGCRLESESSRLDAQLETRLAAVVDAVLGEDDASDAEHTAEHTHSGDVA